MDISKYKIVFFGSSDFALPALEALLNEQVKILAVVTQPDRPAGRSGKLTPTPVKVRGRSQRLPVLDYPTLRDSRPIAEITALAADFAVVVSYGQLIPKEILHSTRKGFVNIHPSLLPKYRGPSPIQFAILNGEMETGVSIMLLDDKMDHGPIIAQKKTSIRETDDYPHLHARLAEEAAMVMMEALPVWINGTLSPRQQDDRAATFTKILTRDDGRINWKYTAEQILRQIRAFTPWPGSWTLLDGQRYKILSAKLAQPKPVPLPGQLNISAAHVFVGCGQMSAVELTKLQPEGKSDMSATAYTRGYAFNHGRMFS